MNNPKSLLPHNRNCITIRGADLESNTFLIAIEPIAFGFILPIMIPLMDELAMHLFTAEKILNARIAFILSIKIRFFCGVNFIISEVKGLHRLLKWE